MEKKAKETILFEKKFWEFIKRKYPDLDECVTFFGVSDKPELAKLLYKNKEKVSASDSTNIKLERFSSIIKNVFYFEKTMYEHFEREIDDNPEYIYSKRMKETYNNAYESFQREIKAQGYTTTADEAPFSKMYETFQLVNALKPPKHKQVLTEMFLRNIVRKQEINTRYKYENIEEMKEYIQESSLPYLSIIEEEGQNFNGGFKSH